MATSEDDSGLPLPRQQPECQPTKGAWQTFILGSLRVGMEGGRKPTLCLIHKPLETAALPCAHLGKNQIKKVHFSRSQNSEQGGGRVQVGCLHSPCPDCFQLSTCPRVLKTLPFLPSSEFLFEILPFNLTRSYKPSLFPIFYANFIYTFFYNFLTCFFFFFFFSLTLYFWNSKLYSSFSILAFWYMLSILYL